MRVRPYTSVEIAEGEAVTLALDATVVPVAARITPRIGDAVTVALDDGVLEWPRVPAPNSCTVEWLADSAGDAACSTCVEVVSRHYFDLADLRAYGDGRDEFSSLTEETLWMARQAATEVFEQAAARSFVRRIGSTTDWGSDGLLVLEHHDVAEIVTEGYGRASDSQLRRTAPRRAYPAQVEYVYGLAAIPAEVSRAVLDLAAYTLRPSNRPIGATGESTDAGYIHFTTAGRDGATAIPEVNAAIEMFGAGRRFLW